MRAVAIILPSAVLLALITTTPGTGVASADSAGSTPPAASTAPVTGACLTEVGALLPLASGDTYAITLHSIDEREGLASGVVALYAGDKRYDLPFKGLLSVPRTELAKAALLVVRFPSAVQVNAAMVASLDGPDGGSCLPMVSYPDSLKVSQRSADLHALIERAITVVPTRVPPPVDLPPVHCSKPDYPAFAKSTEEPPQPSQDAWAIARRAFALNHVVVEVVVVLDDEGRIITAYLPHQTGIPDFDNGAIYSVRHSKYAPGHFRCGDVGGTYKFVVEFDVVP